MKVIELLKKIISIESISRNETKVADIIEKFIKNEGFITNRKYNNIWTWAFPKDKNKPTILLNSHIDTVKPSSKWTYPPFEATVEDDKIIGLGSNDAGAPLVSLLAAFIELSKKEQPYNLIYAATAEEEISGSKGVECILNDIGFIDLGVIGEPTQMQMAIGEKGLLVLDCVAYGKSGHAARNEGVNAIYKALDEINKLNNFSFPKKSNLFGDVKISVTQISAGTQHNVIPDKCSFVVDVRLNEQYKNSEARDIIRNLLDCEVTARSVRLNSSYISPEHPIVKKGLSLGLTAYGSPTTSDQAVIPYTTIKIGPGDSARSHTADEFIYIKEIKNGIDTYIKLLDGLNIN